MFVALLVAASAAVSGCPFGEDQCRPGFVWRGAFPGDKVCVSGAVRSQVAADNANAAANRQPGGGPSGPNTCKPGLVWRDAEPGDEICVSGATRAQAAADNAAAAARRDPVCVEPRTANSLGVLSLNVFGVQTVDGATMETRARRVALWAKRNRVVPDVILLQEVHGWMWTGPRSCGRGFGATVGDYDQIDAMLRGLADLVGVTYRVAYLTGKVETFNVVCSAYESQALLYNPNRLVNLTRTASGPQAHDAVTGLSAVPHLRRSLPLCARGTRLMPLDSLIDGPLGTEKCSRPTPTGPAFAVFTQGGHISGAHVQLAFTHAPDRPINIFNLHPTAGSTGSDMPGVNRLLDAHTPPPFAGPPALYPPIIAGDFNEMHDDLEAHFPSYAKLLSAPADVVAIAIGRPDRFPSQLRARAAQTLVVPDLPDGHDCATPDPRYRVSDHCGLFVRFDQDGSDAGALRGVFIDGPATATTGTPFVLQAVPSGGGPGYAYRWLPGGAAGPTLTATAPSAGATATWTVEVTDTRTQQMRSTQHSVKATQPPPSTACLAACLRTRDICIANNGRRQDCIDDYRDCITNCRP